MTSTAKALGRRLPTSTQRFVRELAYQPPRPMDAFTDALTRIRAQGFEPKLAVDVGAYKGAWTSMLTSVFPACHVVMIEPQADKRPLLEPLANGSSGRIRYHQALVGPTAGEEVEFVEMESGSSVYEEVSPWPRTRVTMTTQRLDDLLGDDAPRVDLLKLDVQGYELEVLKGAPVALGAATLVLLEVSLSQTNAGCPLFAEVVAFMDEANFQVIDLPFLMRRNAGTLWQVDVLFARKGSVAIPDPKEQWA